MVTHATAPVIPPKLFAFLRDLKRHNDRDWFEANKGRYERDVRDPLLAFIDAFTEPLYRISPHFRADARKQGGSLFRIHRDVRFSADKSPYKTHAGVHFRHERAKDVHAPGYYLHLDPDEVFVGVGIWHPERDTLARIRQAILDRPAAWQKAVGAAAFRRRFALSGEANKRPPAGVSADHPLIEDLKRKDYIALADLTEQAVCAPGFSRSLAATWAAATPFMRFLTQAVGAPF